MQLVLWVARPMPSLEVKRSSGSWVLMGKSWKSMRWKYRVVGVDAFGLLIPISCAVAPGAAARDRRAVVATARRNRALMALRSARRPILLNPCGHDPEGSALAAPRPGTAGVFGLYKRAAAAALPRHPQTTQGA